MKTDTDTAGAQEVSEAKLSTTTALNEVSLADVVTIILGRKWVVLSVGLFFALTALAYTLLVSPVYRVETVLSPVLDDPSNGAASALANQLGGFAALAGVNIGGQAGAKSEAIALLTSNALSQRFIDEQNLLPKLFAEKWDSSKGEWAIEADSSEPSLWDALQRFEKCRTVTEDSRTGLVLLSIEWTDPEEAARWATQLTELVNRLMRERAIEEAQSSIDFLRAQLAQTSVLEVQQAIYRLMETQTKNLMLANVREQYAFKVVDPPVIPDLDDPVKPRRGLTIALGLIIGFMIGVVIALALSYRESKA